MRLHLLCDLHLEFGPFRAPSTDADVIVLAGDIHIGDEGLRWARSQFGDKPIVYVLGNHEYYRHSLPDLAETLQWETANSHVHLLENRAVEIGGYTFLGCTLWSDFQLSPNPEIAMRTAENIMSDFTLIEFGPARRLLRARDTVRLHTQSVQWLRRELIKCTPSRTIVVTHHAPSRRSEAPYHADSPLNPAFASDLDALVEPSGIPLWIHGHTHYNVDYVVGSTRVVSNQRGYPDENCQGFNSRLIIEV